MSQISLLVIITRILEIKMFTTLDSLRVHLKRGGGKLLHYLS